MSTRDFTPPFIVPWLVQVSLWICLSLFIVIALGLVFRKFRGYLLDRGFVWLPLLALMMTLFIWAVGAAQTIVDFYLPALFRSHLVGIAAVTVAVILYLVRKNARWLYALIEIAGAILAINVAAIPSGISFSQRAVTVVGAIYFLVRGLDNAEQGMLWAKLWEARHFLPKNIGRQGAIVAVVVAVLGIGAVSRSRLADVAPPYMTSAEKPDKMPVSPMECGELFVTCDERSWHRRARLIHGTDLERTDARIDAERRWKAIHNSDLRKQ